MASPNIDELLQACAVSKKAPAVGVRNDRILWGVQEELYGHLNQLNVFKWVKQLRGHERDRGEERVEFLSAIDN